jgi:hypothetical protein
MPSLSIREDDTLPLLSTPSINRSRHSLMPTAAAPHVGFQHRPIQTCPPLPLPSPLPRLFTMTDRGSVFEVPRRCTKPIPAWLGSMPRLTRRSATTHPLSSTVLRWILRMPMATHSCRPHLYIAAWAPHGPQYIVVQHVCSRH